MNNFSYESEEYKFKETDALEIQLCPSLCREEDLKNLSINIQKARKSFFNEHGIIIPPVKISCCEKNFEDNNILARILVFGFINKVIAKEKEKTTKQVFDEILTEIKCLLLIYCRYLITPEFVSKLLKEVEKEHPALIESLKQKSNYLDVVRLVLQGFNDIKNIVPILEIINDSTSDGNFDSIQKIVNRVDNTIAWFSNSLAQNWDFTHLDLIITNSKGICIGFTYNKKGNNAPYISLLNPHDATHIIQEANERKIPVFAEENYTTLIFEKYARFESINKEDFPRLAELYNIISNSKKKNRRRGKSI